MSDLECDHKEESEEDKNKANATDDELRIHAAKSLRLDIKDSAKQERKGFKAFQPQTVEDEDQIDLPSLKIS